MEIIHSKIVNPSFLSFWEFYLAQPFLLPERIVDLS